MRIRLVVGLCLSVVPLATPSAAARQASSGREVAAIVDLLAGRAVAEHHGVGAAVAVIRRGEPTLFFTYGVADAATGRAVTRRTQFEIGSVTKIFTTNLFGQRWLEGGPAPWTPLSSFSAQLGALPTSAGRITLQQLGTFTAGYRTTPPRCGSATVPGCLPFGRPTIDQYGASSLAAYFDATQGPATLPAGYLYSDISTGLLGLLLATPDGPLTDGSVEDWFSLVRSDLLRPLGMTHTVLVADPTSGDLAAGYEIPLFGAELAAGGLSGVRPLSIAGPFASPPALTVEGGGGSGAVLLAQICPASGTIGDTGCTPGDLTGASVTQPGSGYVAPPAVAFCPSAGGCGHSAVATGTAVVEGGRVVAIGVDAAGDNYTPGVGGTIAVSVSGGRAAGGRDAAGVAQIANGQVVHVSVTDPGSGYLPPLRIIATPGGPIHNAVPVWAAAGSLKSDLGDMARLAEAALAPFGTMARGVPRAVQLGFLLAETPEVCAGGSDPSPFHCPSDTPWGGLAWSITHPDLAHAYPATISKDGGLPGFSSVVEIVPAEGLGVVVLLNSRQVAGSDSGAGEEAAPVGLVAPTIARQIVNALHFGDVVPN